MPKILFVTGPAGAGKTTTCEEFAKSMKGTWACISQDHIRTFIKAGFKNPTKPWDSNTHKQWDVSQAICGDILRRYQTAGINCIVDCFAAKGSFDKWDEVLYEVDYQLIVLLPSLEMTVIRNSKRNGDALMEEDKVREHHEWFTAWEGDKRATIIDTTDQTVKEAIEEIRKVAKI